MKSGTRIICIDENDDYFGEMGVFIKYKNNVILAQMDCDFFDDIDNGTYFLGGSLKPVEKAKFDLL